MSKFFVRLTVLLVAIYFIICHINAMVWQINIWSHTYTVMFEICVCLCMSAQGKYQCKYMRWTAYAVCLTDILVSLDELFDILPYTIAVIAPFAILSIGLLTTTTLAIKHYIKVKRRKRIWKVNNISQS